MLIKRKYGIPEKKTKQGEGERAEDMKFPGIYPILGSERPFALFNGVHGKWYKLDFALY